MEKNQILVAKITTAFGIKGEVKLVCFLEDYKKIEKYPLFDAAGNSLKVTISNKGKTAIKTTATGDVVLIAKVDGIKDRNDAETARGKEIFAKRDNFEEIKSDEFYINDLIGLDVVDMNSNKIGKVENIVDYGAGMIVEIEFDKIPQGKKTDIINNFPFQSEIFPEIDVKNGFVRIDMPELV